MDFIEIILIDDKWRFSGVMVKVNKSFVMFGFMLICILVSCRTSDAFAYTASITTSDSISLNASPSSNGVSIYSDSINVVSDCKNGYNLTVVTPNGSDLYKYENDAQASNIAAFSAVDGISALGSDNNINRWGYTLINNPNSDTVFSPLSTTASILKTPSETASSDSDINDAFNIYYGIRVDNTTDAGNYRMAENDSGTAGSIVYQLTMNTTCAEYTVSFDANGGSGSMEDQRIQQGDATKLTAASAFTAPTGDSYTDTAGNTITGDPDKLWTFWGWNTEIDGTGNWYKDRESVEDLTMAGSTITLYAQWKQATLADLTTGTQVGTEKTIDHNTMQDMSPEACYNTEITTADNAPAATLVDMRGKVITNDPVTTESPEQYTISKLADGLCWMTTNLNLGRTGTDGPNEDGTVTLTSDDTDLDDNTNFILPAADTTSYTATGNLARVRLTNNSGNIANGAYYSWSSAVANTTSTNSSPTTSICPKNWDLPSDAMYTNLSSKSSYSSSNRTTDAPSTFLVDGGFTNGSGFYQNGYGYYWTNRSYSTTSAYGARINSTSISTSSSTSTTYGGNKYYRKNIRCVASRGRVTINYDGNGTSEYPTTGSVASQENVELNTNPTVSSNGFTRAGWNFNGWNTKADGSGISVSAGMTISGLDLKPGGSITLYAMWLPQYVITYVNNCRSFASSNELCTQADSDTTSEQKINLNASGNGSGTLADYNKWTLTGWKIKEWTTNADGTGTVYPIGSRYSVTGQSVATVSGITLYAHWVQIYSIQYDGNGASNINGMGTTDSGTGVKSVTQTNIGEGDNVQLLASNFKRAGHGFAGWSTDSNAWTHFTDNDTTNDPVIYGPMETISAPAYPNNGTSISTMYAVWVPAEEDNNNDPVYLQDFSVNECNNLTATTFNSSTGAITPGSVIALTDKRDNQVYTIARLADGKCWMVENLRLDNQYTMGQNQNDSSVTNESLAQGYGGTPGTYGSFVGLANPETSNFSNSTTSNSVYKSSANPPVDTYDPANNVLEDVGSGTHRAHRIPRYNNSNTNALIDGTTYSEDYINVSSPSKSGTYSAANLFSYGNYYNWAAAIANTNHYENGASTESETVNTSICPSGWHLPSSNDNPATREYNVLAKQYGGTGSSQGSSSNGSIMSNYFRDFPNNFMYAGEYSGSSVSNRGSYGTYWSRTSDSDDRAESLYLSAVELNPSYWSGYRYYGRTIRCLADDYSIQYDDNGADNPNGMGVTDAAGRKGVKQGGITEGTDVTLLASNYKRAGHGFAGWSTDSNAWTHYTDNDATNDPIIYGPMQDVTVDSGLISEADSKGLITMYAVWIPAEKDGSNNTVYLQDFSVNECNNLTATTFNSSTGTITPGSLIALTDKRDNQVYTIARLADGKCWMVENLRLDNQYTMGQNQNDSSVTNESLAQGYGGTPGTYGRFVGLANSESSNFSNSKTSNSVYKSSADPPVDIYDPINNVLEDIGTSYYPGYRIPRYNNSNTNNLIDSTTFVQDNYGDTNRASAYSSSRLYSYGNYYTWAAAIANTNYYQYGVSPSSEEVNTSICPSGWHLPSEDSEFSVIFDSYGKTTNNALIMSSRFRTFPNNFLKSGSMGSGSNDGRGNSGLYWTRTGLNANNTTYSSAFHFGLTSSYTDTFRLTGTNDRYYGYTVRCLADDYSIQYDDNGADNPNGMGTTDATGRKSVKQGGITEGIDVTLLASNYKRAGHGFAGWSTDSNAWTHYTDNDATNDPTIYGPMEDVTVDSSLISEADSKGLITMYAVWIPAEKDGNNNTVYLQDFGTTTCNNLTATTFDSSTGTITPGSLIALTDKRDNQVYTIARLADGKCWMVENLRLDNQYTMGQNQNDSSVTNESLAQGYGGTPGTYGRFVGLANSESTNFTSSSTVSNSVYKSSANPPVDTYNPNNSTLEDIGTSNSPGYRFPRYNNSNTNGSIDSTTYVQDYGSSESTSTYLTSNLYSYGNYYTWSAAIANTNYYTNQSTSNAANTSICPSGWHLPSSDNNTSEYSVLSIRYGGTGDRQYASNGGDVMSSRLRTFPNNYIYSGDYSGSSAVNRGTEGHYWSRTRIGSNVIIAGSFELASETIDTSESGYLYYGFAIRCITDDYTIQYNDNGADNPNGMGTTDATGRKSVKQGGITEGTDVTLLASNYKRAGYGFAGWSTDSNAWTHYTDNDATNDPTIYGPMEDVTVDSSLISEADSKGIITMYAVWVPAEKDGSNNTVYLQDFGATECNNMNQAIFNSSTGTIAPGNIVALTDKRDNQVYTIARLADGKCWMVENLRLDNQYTMGQNQNDSSVTNESLAQGYGGTPGTYGSFVGLANSESSNFYTSAISNSVYKSSANPPVDTYDPINNTLEDIGTSNSPGYRFPRYNNNNTSNSIDSTYYVQDYGSSESTSAYLASNLYSYGNYYTWAAAMANTTYYTNQSASNTANTSICPSGWHLPSSDDNTSEYNNLSKQYGGTGDRQYVSNGRNVMSSRFRTFPNNFVYSGEFYRSSASYRGTEGRYWSRTRISSNVIIAGDLELESDTIDPSESGYLDYGLSIRCVADD